jgi:hypothetical protein
MEFLKKHWWKIFRKILKGTGIVIVGLALIFLFLKALPYSNRRPVIYNLGIKDFGPYDASTGRAGAFVILPKEGNYNEFFPFGSVVASDQQGHKKTLPEMEFTSLAPHTPVYAAADGWVQEIAAQEEVPGVTGYEILVPLNFLSNWVLDYDHVVNLKIKKGQYVKAGEQIGEAAPQGSWAQGQYRTELAISNTIGSLGIPWFIDKDWCPMQFLAPSVKDKYTNDIIQLETTLVSKGSAGNLYDLATQPYPGCQVTSFKE